ncbi:hypothetical protein [Candidatus Albibeggiatoa sp. nov. NOAA]|uniref:hypothetical protein n=1 Tax=Candidatus Albibeggiatoa sp. nov. NOAA TaxID=3162724 RepID=UPI0032F67D86|nr:hypothetical protein [Thiotrichaceae bacterium]
MFKLRYSFNIQYILPILFCQFAFHYSVHAAIQAANINNIADTKIILSNASDSECRIEFVDLNGTLINNSVSYASGEGAQCDSAIDYLDAVLYNQPNETKPDFFCFKTPANTYGWGRHDCNEILEVYYEDSGSVITIPEHDIPEFEPLPTLQVAVGEEVLFHVKAISSGGYQIVYNTQNAPTRRRFNQYSGQFSWVAGYKGQFDFEIVAQEQYSSTNQKAVLPVTIIVNDFTLASFGIDPTQLDTFTATDIAALTPESMVAFRGNDIKSIPATAFSGLSAEQLEEMTTHALKAISSDQFNYIPISSFSGLKSTNLAGFNTNVIQHFTLAHLQAINSIHFQNLADANLTKMLTNLSTNLVNTDLLDELLPDTWKINGRTGEIYHPKGTPLSFRGLDLNIQPSVAQGKLAYYDELPSFDSNISLGGLGNIPTLLAEMNHTLQQLGLSNVQFFQRPDGLLTSYGALNLSMLPNIDSFAQTTEKEHIAVSDTQGTVKFVTDNQHYFEFIPAPKNTAALLQALGEDGQTTIGKSGDTILSYTPLTTTRTLQTQVHLVVIFDAFVTPAPANFCADPSCTQFKTGMFFNQTNLRDLRADSPLPEIGRMVYADGTSQLVYPAIVAPHFFTSGLQQLSLIKSVTPQNSGREYQVTFNSGDTLTVYPSFNVKVTNLAKGQHVTPSFYYSFWTETLTYTVAVKNQLFTQELQVQ